MVQTRCRAMLLSATLLASGCAFFALPRPISAQTQAGALPATLAPLRHGPLIVWYVAPEERAPETGLQAIAALHDATPLTYQEQASGSFGQDASSFGVSSGSYGIDSSSSSISTPKAAQGQDAPSATQNGIAYREQESGNFGDTAGSYGTTSGSYGITGSNLGQTAGSYGTTAGSYGQTAGSLGEASRGGGDTAPKVSHAASVEQLMNRIRHVFPDLRAAFYEVDPAQLQDKLTAAKGTPQYPDVLLGTLPQTWWSSLQGQFGLAQLRAASFRDDGVTENAPPTDEFAILAHAPDMEVARAFALWMSEPYAGCPGCVESLLSAKEEAAAKVAASAVERLLHGQTMGDEADPAMAGNLSQGVRRMLTTTRNTVAEDGPFHVEVEQASVNGNLAAVVLRTVVSSDHVFGVAHPLIILRTGREGRWRVLHASMNLPQFEEENVRRTLMHTSPPSAAEQRTGVKGVSIAAPQEGATRTARPELVWDNGGGAGLQVVEWQLNLGHSWSDAHIYLVDDRSPRLRTHVIAQFASDAGRYRWRVWSVGTSGEMKISLWRSFSVAP